MMTLVENPRRAHDPFAPHLVDDGDVETAVSLEDELHALTVKELRARAAEENIELPKKGKHDELVQLLAAAIKEREETSMLFPRDRFKAAGASDAELDALEAEFNEMPEQLRAQNLAFFNERDTAGLAEALEARREAGIPGVDDGDVETVDEGPVRDPEDLKKVQELISTAERFQGDKKPAGKAKPASKPRASRAKAK